MDLNKGKDGAKTAVDEACSTQVYIGQKKSTCRHQQKRVKGCMSYYIRDFLLVQEVLRDNLLEEGKATKLYWIV